MKKPPHVIEVFLQPGELWFGDRNTRLRTILGSCVTVTLWHPRLLVGGMCHYMLPSRSKASDQVLDGRYGDEALAMLRAEVHACGTEVHEFEAKLSGGGRMFHRATRAGGYAAVQVSDRNIEAGRALLARHGFKLKAEHVGGQGHREVILDIWNGHVWIRHAPLPGAERMTAQRSAYLSGEVE